MEQQMVKRNKLTAGEHIKLFTWRNIMMPLIDLICGKSYPTTRVTEYSYGNLPAEKMDYFKPSKTAILHSPVIHFHGGGWTAGTKGRLFTKPLTALADAGYPVFSVNYPLAPEYPHPYALRSLLKALALIKKQYPEYNAVHLTGDSAGGHLAMMLGIMLANKELLKQFDEINADLLPEVKSIVPVYGIFDRFNWIEDGFPLSRIFLKSYAGEKALNKDYIAPIPVMPIEIKKFKTLPPTFILAASKDHLLRSSIEYAAHLRKQFNHVELKVYEGSSHGFFSFGHGSDEVIIDLLNFYNRF